MVKAMNIKEALAYANKKLMKSVNDAMKNEVFEAVKAEESEAIITKVYNAYKPEYYDRRGQYEGLGDPENIVIDGSVTNGRMKIINVTEPNPGGCFDIDRVTVDKNLSELVEYGHGYSGYKYDFLSKRKKAYLKARHFTSATVENLANSNAHVDALKSGLKRQGFHVE